MNNVKSILVSILFLVSCSLTAVAQNKVVVIPVDDGFMPMVLPAPPEPEPVAPVDAVFLDEAIGKQMVWNKGWDTSIGHRTKMDPTVKISLIRLEPVFGYPGIIYPGNEIRHWGLQQVFISPKKIYAKGALFIDRGSFVEGGPFEFSLNQQGFMSFHNIVRKDAQSGWIGAWTDPRPGDKVWFFIISDDERLSSNPITFTWP